MLALPFRQLQQAQVLTAASKQKYRLIKCASSHHKHVWLGERESDGESVIIKFPLRDHLDEQRKAIRQLETEMAVLTSPLKNTEGIRQLVDHITLPGMHNDQISAAVYEHLDVDLHQLHLVQRVQLSNPQIKSIARQLLKALSNTHKHNIIHTDLKPENVVISRLTSLSSSNILVKVIDFGVASRSDKDRVRMITNPYWRSPESWVGMAWGPASDIWSFGAIIGSLLMEPGAKLFQPMGGRPYTPTAAKDLEFLNSLWTIAPFPKNFIEQLPDKWRKAIYDFSPRLAPNGQRITLEFIQDIFEIPEEDWAFIKDVLQPDPRMRPSADQLLQHSWLDSVD